MANQITGKILYIYPTQQLTSKDGSKTFYKRSIVLDLTRFDPYTGERSQFENTPMLEFTNDRCQELDKFKVGQVVTISFDVQGTRYKDKSGAEQIFTRIQPYKIEAKQQRNEYDPQPTAQPIQQQFSPTQQPIPQQQPQAAPSAPQGWPPSVDENGLPF